MFGARFFSARMFAPRFFAEAGANPSGTAKLPWHLFFERTL